MSVALNLSRVPAGGRHEHVAVAPHRHDGLRVELAAQPGHAGVDRAVVGVETVGRRHVQEVVAAEDAVRVAREGPRQGDLAGAEPLRPRLSAPARASTNPAVNTGVLP